METTNKVVPSPMAYPAFDGWYVQTDVSDLFPDGDVNPLPLPFYGPFDSAAECVKGGESWFENELGPVDTVAYFKAPKSN